MPLKEIEPDFYKDFRGWAYDLKTCQAMIALRDEKMVYRHIFLIDQMWLVNYSKKDIDCLFFNKIMYYPTDKEQALQYQKVVNVCFEEDINSGCYWESSWRDLECEEFLKEQRHNERMDQKMAEAAKRARWILGMGSLTLIKLRLKAKNEKFPGGLK
ncbi:hypothetical protein Hanom_Chr08g00707161 [Helianthus anomalus]